MKVTLRLGCVVAVLFAASGTPGLATPVGPFRAPPTATPDLPTTPDAAIVRPASDRDRDGFDTDLASRPIVKSNISTFEVAGFKLGMSANEVERVARSRHLRTGMLKQLQPFADTLSGDRMDSFDTLVANIAADRLHSKRPPPIRVIRQVSLKDEDGNHWDLRFRPTEQGPTLASIAYFTTMNGNTGSTYLAALRDRYGPANQSGANGSRMTASWCARSDPTCGYSPYLNVVSDGAAVNFYLDSGILERKALDARIEARGAGLSGANARKPVF